MFPAGLSVTITHCIYASLSLSAYRSTGSQMKFWICTSLLPTADGPYFIDTFQSVILSHILSCFHLVQYITSLIKYCIAEVFRNTHMQTYWVHIHFNNLLKLHIIM